MEETKPLLGNNNNNNNNNIPLNNKSIAENDPMVQAKLKTVKFFSGFQEFINKGNVIQLGVAFVLGAAFQAVVKSFVDDILMPPFGLIGGNNFQNLFIVMKHGNTPGAKYDTITEAAADSAVTWNYGKFIQVQINFLVIAFFLYLFICTVTTIWEKASIQREAQQSVVEQKCTFCLKMIPVLAKKCCFCCTPLEPVVPETETSVTREQTNKTDGNSVN